MNCIIFLLNKPKRKLKSKSLQNKFKIISHWSIVRNERFYVKEVMNEILYEYVPVKQIKSNSGAPWITPYIKRIIRTKKRKWLKYKRSPIAHNLSEYKTFCKFVKTRVNDARAQYEKHKFQNRASNPKQFFNYIGSKTKDHSAVPALMVNGAEVIEDPCKAEALSKHYQTVFTRADGKVPIFDFIVPENSLCDISVSDSDIVAAIQRMNADGSPGSDNFHPGFLKKIYPYIIKPLCTIFNCSLQTGILPSSWKHGIIVPIYKKNGKPSLCASYRPICLTSVICKLLEKVIYRKIIEYFRLHGVISKAQHGFLSGKSTTTNLYECMNDWSKLVDAGSSVDIIYIDLQKAFDSVSHQKLMYKLTRLGVGGNLFRWLEDFLCGRQQFVRVGGSESNFTPVISGIPQGTILGPLLFLLYINDLPELVKHCKISLYADDSKFFGKSDDISDCLAIFDDVLTAQNWFDEWQLKINRGKCEVLHVGRRNPDFPYRLNEFVLPSATSCRDLGVSVSWDLSSHLHCVNICRSAQYRLKQFMKTFACRDREFMIFLFKTYIRPLLESNTTVWSPHCVCDIDLVEKVQRRFTKQIPGLKNVPYMQRLQSCHLPTLESRRIYFDVVLMYKIIH